MTHYLVGVITEERPTESDIDEILAPFDENISVEPYIKYTFDEVKAEFADILTRNAEADVDEDWKFKEQFAKLKLALENNDIEGIRMFNEWYRWFEDIDDKGNALSTYNPNSKWDWWSIGGRWDSGDGCFIELVDLKRFSAKGLSEEDLASMYPKIYEEYRKYITEGSFYTPEYYLQKYPTFESYLTECKNDVPYAFIDENGTWHEPGEMMWFGLNTATSETIEEYNERFWETVERLPSGYMTLVDCHI